MAPKSKEIISDSNDSEDEGNDEGEAKGAAITGGA